MCIWVADIDGEGIPPTLLQERHQSALDLSERILPAHAQPPVIPTHQWFADTIRIGMQLLETVSFWTDVAMAENVLSISPDGENLAATCFDL